MPLHTAAGNALLPQARRQRHIPFRISQTGHRYGRIVRTGMPAGLAVRTQNGTYCNHGGTVVAVFAGIFHIHALRHTILLTRHILHDADQSVRSIRFLLKVSVYRHNHGSGSHKPHTDSGLLYNQTFMVPYKPPHTATAQPQVCRNNTDSRIRLLVSNIIRWSFHHISLRHNIPPHNKPDNIRDKISGQQPQTHGRA